MNAVAVRGLDKQEIRSRNRIRVTQDGLIRLPEVAREDQLRLLPVLLHHNLENRRAENMSCVAEGKDQIVHLQWCTIGDGFEQPKCGKGIRLRIERCNRCFAAARVLAVEQLRITFLNMRRVGQHDADEIAGGARRIDLPAEALAHEARNAPAVINMCVRQKDRLDLGGIERKVLIVHLAQTARSLIHAAVHKIPVIAHMKQIA